MEAQRVEGQAHTPAWLEDVNLLRLQGRTLFDSDRFQDACDVYTEALDVLQRNTASPSEQPKLASILLSNRAACRAKLQQHRPSLDDALHAIRLNSTWPKAHSRAAAAHTLLGDNKRALVHYTVAVSLANHPQYRQGILSCLEGIVASCYELPQLDTSDVEALLRCPLSGDTLHKPVTQFFGLSVSRLCLQVVSAFVHGKPFFPQRQWDVREPACDVVLNNVVERLHPNRAQAQDLGCTVLTKVLKALAEEPQAAVEKGGRRTAATSRASVANQPLLASSPAPWPARHQTPAAQPQHHPLLVQGPLLLFPMASDNNNSSSSSSSSNGDSDENVPAFDQGGGGGEQTHAREEEMGEEGEAEDEVAQARLHRGGATHGDGSVTTAGAWISPHSTSRRGTTEAPQARTLSLQEFEALREEASALCESSPTPFSFLALAKILQHQKDHDRALECLSAGLRQFPNSGLLTLMKAECELARGKVACFESLLRAARLHCRPAALPHALVELWLQAVHAACAVPPGTRGFEEQAAALVQQHFPSLQVPDAGSGVEVDTGAFQPAVKEETGRPTPRSGPTRSPNVVASDMKMEHTTAACAKDTHADESNQEEKVDCAHRGSVMDVREDDEDEAPAETTEQGRQMPMDEEEEGEEEGTESQKGNGTEASRKMTAADDEEAQEQQDPAAVASSLLGGHDNSTMAEQSTSTSAGSAPLSVSDVECQLCYSLLVEPVTTPCGHCFCRVCLHRVLDHSPACPVCRTPLRHLLARHELHTSQVLQALLRCFFREPYEEREQQLREELEEQSTHLPIFICMMCLPGWPCHLHVFEPRYRLMIRRCLESGQRRFGMCQATDDGAAEYGVVLSIDRCELIEDGRSLLETTATRRFHILESDIRDDYLVAKVEYIDDEPQDPQEHDSGGRTYEELLDQARNLGASLMRSLPAPASGMLMEHFGELPDNDDHLAFWLAGVMQLDPTIQYNLLRSTSRLERLSSVLSLGRGPRCSIM